MARRNYSSFRPSKPRGLPRDGGPTGVMCYEHELGRATLTGMSEALAAVQAGNPLALGRFTEHARAYITLLREHIQKEDHCLFNMADQAFTQADEQQLLAAFAQVESEHLEVGAHEKYAKIADELADRFHVPRAEPATGGCHGCCGH